MSGTFEELIDQRNARLSIANQIVILNYGLDLIALDADINDMEHIFIYVLRDEKDLPESINYKGKIYPRQPL